MKEIHLVNIFLIIYFQIIITLHSKKVKISELNNKEENPNNVQKEYKENTNKEGMNKFNDGLKILAELITRDIYEKRKGNFSDKCNT